MRASQNHAIHGPAVRFALSPGRKKDMKGENSSQHPSSPCRRLARQWRLSYFDAAVQLPVEDVGLPCLFCRPAGDVRTSRHWR